MFKTYILDIIDTIKYDLLFFQKPYIDKDIIDLIPKKLNIEITAVKGEGVTYTFKELPGMVLFSNTFNDALEVINDGLATYYDIPRYYSKNFRFINYLVDKNGQVIASLKDDDNLLLVAQK